MIPAEISLTRWDETKLRLFIHWFTHTGTRSENSVLFYDFGRTLCKPPLLNPTLEANAANLLHFLLRTQNRPFAVQI